MDYATFLKSKGKRFTGEGFDCEASRLPVEMFEWQKKIVTWATKKGRCALWADTGLGKTIMQLAWADQVAHHTGKPVLILTPLAVSAQTVKEALRFGLKASICADQSDVCGNPIAVTNYHKLHRFDASAFGGVVLDESSILKSFTGKVKQQLCESFKRTPYRLACTATPAPNDHLELGNHAAFLSIMESNEMISRWFMNDAMEAGNYRLKGHAKRDFWQWVASWALVLRSPSDLGYDSTGYDLPPLKIHHVTIPTSGIYLDGALFADASLSATNLHSVLRQTASIRAEKAAQIVACDPDKDWLIWTHTNYEADELVRVMPQESIEVRGSDDAQFKESSALWMSGLQVNRPSRTIGTSCKKTTSRNTTKNIEIGESQSLLNGSAITVTDGEPICANMSSSTETRSLHSEERMQQRGISEGESSTLQTSQLEEKLGHTQSRGKKRIQKSDLPKDSLHMGSRLTATDPYLKSKVEGVPFAGHPNAEIIPNALRAASVGFMSITATQREGSEVSCAQTAISDLGSLETHYTSLSGQLNTFRRILISKSEIFGFGMNFQACHNMIFVGMDYSYEKFYQAVRRCWRYGQVESVSAYLLCTDMEWRLFDSLSKKQAAHVEMQNEMIAMMKEEYAELTCTR